MSREDRIRFGLNIPGTERTFYTELIDEPRFFDRNLHLRRRGEFDRRRVVDHVVHLQRIGIDHQVVRTVGFAPDRDRLFLPLLDQKVDRAQFDRLRRIDRTFGIHHDRYFVIAVAFEPFDRRTADRNLIVAILEKIVLGLVRIVVRIALLAVVPHRQVDDQTGLPVERTLVVPIVAVRIGRYAHLVDRGLVADAPLEIPRVALGGGRHVGILLHARHQSGRNRQIADVIAAAV